MKQVVTVKYRRDMAAPNSGWFTGIQYEGQSREWMVLGFEFPARGKVEPESYPVLSVERSSRNMHILYGENMTACIPKDVYIDFLARVEHHFR